MNKRIKLTTRAIAGAALLALIGAFLLPARDERFSTLAGGITLNAIACP